MYVLQQIQDRAGAPGLGGTRVRAEYTIFVRQLGKTCPNVLLDMTAKGKEELVDVMQGRAGILSGKNIQQLRAKISKLCRGLTALPAPTVRSK